ncbi:unnamed protein product [Arabis nemorensis]|uniref:eRF1/Pelota-like N-terminal domain-containing protein n=1 Tax=Arabis nemorensis TaxID=586526 RepID=A0A565BLG5_9BRAS|nr:unnamed protein product [Arabis nemorensis]
MHIEIWKLKKLIKSLEAARGIGTSMITLIIPPRDQISRVTKMLVDEYGTASHIKSRVNRQSVLAAITYAQQRLQLYNKVPRNGLVLYTGTVVNEEGREKKFTTAFEPFRPINSSLYLCDNKFHTEALSELLETDDRFGFIVIDGKGTFFGTMCGNSHGVLHKFTVDLPKKHGRGGQLALRFDRLRVEKGHNYLRKTSELATQLYTNPSTNQPNVTGLILAGEDGFNEAIKLSSHITAAVKFVKEKCLLDKYFKEINQDTGKYVMKNSLTGETVIKHLNKEEERDATNIKELDVKEKMPLIEWFADEYKRFGCALEFVTNKSQEGYKFCKDLGGIGGILRYKLDMSAFDSEDAEVSDDDGSEVREVSDYDDDSG